jgi:hypothetical protein
VRKWEEIKQEIQRESCCSSCQKIFKWDKNLNYSAAKKKALAEIQDCQKVCALPQKPKLVVKQED